MRLAAAAVLALVATAGRADPTAEAARSYQVEGSASPAALKVGGAGTLILSIQPVPKAHVDPNAPLKITLASTPGLTLAKVKLGRGDVAADSASGASRFVVPFTASAAGPQQATATLDFFICTDQWCVKQIREVKVSVDVK